MKIIWRIREASTLGVGAFPMSDIVYGAQYRKQSVLLNSCSLVAIKALNDELNSDIILKENYY